MSQGTSPSTDALGTSHAEPAALPAEAAISMFRLVLGMFISSVGAALFSLLIFRLLSFFVMPSMFFALLLVGFPIGAAWTSRNPETGARRFRRMLAVLQAVMVATLLVTLLAKHVDYLRANLLVGVAVHRLLTQVLVFALLYLPFFVAYGATEYAGYQAGTAAFGQRMRPVYGLFLFGGAAAFMLTLWLQRTLGVPRLLIVAVTMVGLSRMILVAGRVRSWAVAELAVLAGLICLPIFDHAFMAAFKSSKEVEMSAARYREQHKCETEFEGWGRYSYLEILRGEFPNASRPTTREQGFIGLYNDVAMWYFFRVGAGTSHDPLDRDLWPPRDQLPFLILPKRGARVAIVGAGGGREVEFTRAAGAERILALEIEPGVVDAVRGPLREGFDEIYNRPPVEVHSHEARGFLERTSEQFDLILLMTVGGYPQLMLEPGDMIRTREAFELYASRLKPGGALAISYDEKLDQHTLLLRQYYHTLRGMGFECHALRRPRDDVMLLAFAAGADGAQKERREQTLRQLGKTAWLLNSGDLYLDDFRIITDDRPFLAGNIRNILPEDQIWMLAQLLTVVLLVAGVGLGMMLHATTGRQAPQRQAPWLGSGGLFALAALIGANFMLLEHMCVTQLFRHTYAYYDSLMIGIVAYLTLTGLGSLLIPRRLVAWLVPLAAAVAIAWWIRDQKGSVATTAACLVPLLLLTGTFFPLVFEQVPRGRLALFGMDAVGAAAGGLAAFFVPMLFGFRVFAAVAIVVFIATGLAMLVFLRTAAGFKVGWDKAA